MEHMKIIKHIISSCPYGELEDLLSDLKTLYPDFQAELFEEDIQTHHESHCGILRDG